VQQVDKLLVITYKEIIVYLTNVVC